jgi:hypothetical protein
MAAASAPLGCAEFFRSCFGHKFWHQGKIVNE